MLDKEWKLLRQLESLRKYDIASNVIFRLKTQKNSQTFPKDKLIFNKKSNSTPYRQTQAELFLYIETSYTLT